MCGMYHLFSIFEMNNNLMDQVFDRQLEEEMNQFYWGIRLLIGYFLRFMVGKFLIVMNEQISPVLSARFFLFPF